MTQTSGDELSALAGEGFRWLTRILGDLDPNVFFDNYWEKRHLFVPAHKSLVPADLLNEDEINDFFARNDVRYPTVQMVKGGRNLPLSDYSNPIKIGTYSDTGLIDMDRVIDSYRAGGTVIVQLMQKSFGRISTFTSELSAFVRGKVDVHGFFTPSSAQGLTAHYDVASAFLIQLKGAKKWRLYDMEIEAPAPDQTFDSRNPLKGSVIDEVTMRTGDVMYLPRGLPHEGITQESDSLHLTVVLWPQSWLDILSITLQQCEKIESFRQAPTTVLTEEKGRDFDLTWDNIADQFKSKIESAVSETTLYPSTNPPASRRGRWL
ncbi:MAG: cupin domain-containing protein [Bacteroidota bacterium]|jgi:ribosomal protein L16 Arg81 hydroxylase